MPDIILDTNLLADFLAQFFGSARRGRDLFTTQGAISRELARKINYIVIWHNWNLESKESIAQHPGWIGAATFAFVEIAHKWTDIVRERFTVEQMAGFVEHPPAWFVIEPIDENLVDAFFDAPTDALTARGETRSPEWPDTIQVAVAFGRGDACLLAVTDQEVRRIDVLQNRLV